GDAAVASMVAVSRGLSNYVAMDCDSTPSLMVLTPAFITPQPLFDADRGLIGAFIGVGGHSFGFQQRSGVQMQNAFGAEPKTVTPNYGMARIAAAKIFRGRFPYPLGDALPQGRADPDVLAGNTQRHVASSRRYARHTARPVPISLGTPR